MTDPAPKKTKNLWWRVLHRHDRGVTENVAMRELVIVALVGAIIIGGAFAIAFHFVRPAPPDEFTISTGYEGGAYHLFGDGSVQFVHDEIDRVAYSALATRAGEEAARHDE